MQGSGRAVRTRPGIYSAASVKKDRYNPYLLCAWFIRLFSVTISSMIQRLFLHDTRSLADWPDQTSGVLHVVPQASHIPVTRNACCGRDIPNGGDSVTKSMFQLLVAPKGRGLPAPLPSPPQVKGRICMSSMPRLILSGRNVKYDPGRSARFV